MVTWVPGHSDCTASASTWAASWRISSSARGSSRLTNSILASCAIGSARSASAPSSAIATVRLASDGEIALATSKPVMPVGYSRRAPSGKVSATEPVAAIFKLLLLTRCLRLSGRKNPRNTAICRIIARLLVLHLFTGNVGETLALHPAVGVARRGQVFWPVVSIILFQGFDRHPKIACSFQQVGAGLHLPRRRGVPEDVRRRVFKSGFLSDEPHSLINTGHGVPTPFDHVPGAIAFPRAQVEQQTVGQWDRRVTLFRDLGPLWRPKEAPTRIDPWAALFLLEGRSAHHGSAPAGV